MSADRIAWSGSGTFSNGTDGTSVALTIPPASYGQATHLFVGIAGKGGTSTALAEEHNVMFDGPAFPAPETVVFTHNEEGIDEYTDWTVVRFLDGRLDAGATISVKTIGPTASPPEIGLAVGAIVGHTNAADIYSSSQSGQAFGFSSTLVDSNNWALPFPGVTSTPRGVLGAVLAFVHTPNPPDEPVYSGSGWAAAVFARTSDGRGFGQALGKIAFYTPTDAEMGTPGAHGTFASPFITTINNAALDAFDDNGVSDAPVFVWLDIHAAGGPRAFATVIG